MRASSTLDEQRGGGYLTQSRYRLRYPHLNATHVLAGGQDRVIGAYVHQLEGKCADHGAESAQWFANGYFGRSWSSLNATAFSTIAEVCFVSHCAPTLLNMAISGLRDRVGMSSISMGLSLLLNAYRSGLRPWTPARRGTTTTGTT
jgi:hypothetical protein